MTTASSSQRAGTAAIFACGVVAAVVLARQVLVLFLGVTVGVPAYGFLSWARESFWHVGVELACPLSGSVAWCALAAPAAMLLTRRVHARHGWGRSTVFAATWAAAVLVVVSYRLPAALALLGACWFGWRQVATLGRMAAWALVVASFAFALSPVDVSLRQSSRGGHLAPAVAGAMTLDGVEANAAGDVVVVGGCGAMYNEPRWVWVW